MAGRLTTFSLLLPALLLVAGMQQLEAAAELHVDCTHLQGKLRPLHGVNNGPVNQGETVDLSSYYRAAAFPSVRLHDCEWPDPDLVDLHTIFPDMTKDPETPAHYRFTKTDRYIQAIVNAASGIVFRLGESIEHTKDKYYVHPPAEYDRWASVCLGIIRHYNEGWADGYHHGIEYWEIWNEPENRPNMWTGTDLDYYRLYEATARKIKKAFPDLKVGGPSIGAPGEFAGAAFNPSPFLEGFLEYVKCRSLPLDFFSWHTYTNDPSIYRRKTEALRALLDRFGFAHTEIHLNEWNYLPDNNWKPISVAGQGELRQAWSRRQGGIEGAAFVAYVLLDLQESPVDAANFYSGDTNLFGLFTRCAVPKKTYYAMRAFHLLLDTPFRVKLTNSAASPGLIAAAGINGAENRLSVLISNFSSDAAQLTLKLTGFRDKTECSYTVHRLDAQHNLTKTEENRLEGPSLAIQNTASPCVLLVTFEQGGSP